MVSEAQGSRELKLSVRRTCVCHVSVRVSVGGNAVVMSVPLDEFSQLLDLARTVVNGTSQQAVLMMDLEPTEDAFELPMNQAEKN